MNKCMLVTLLSLFFLATGHATGGQTHPTIPPERAFKWDISRKNSVVTQDFDIRECKGYLFAIGFGGPDAAYEDGRVRPDSNQSWRKLLRTTPDGPRDGPLGKFIGQDFDYSYYRKDGSDPNPIRFKTQEEADRKEELYRQGVYTRRGDLGVIVPIQFVVEKIDDSGIASVLTDQAIETGGLMSGGHLIARKISWEVKMKRGHHRVTATTLRDSPLPEGVGTYLTISRMHNTSAPKDCD